MGDTWKVTTNNIDGRTVYGVYRIEDPEQIQHSGNREVLGYYDTREEAEETAEAFNRAEVGANDRSGVMEAELPIENIKANPLNPRKAFNEEKLEELAESIRQMGVLQPLIVAKDAADPGKYYLIAGERRLKAAAMAGLDRVPVIYRSGLYEEPETQVVAMLIENLQREDLDPIEEARAFAELTREHGWTQTDLAAKIGVSQSHIANRIRLLILPESAQEAISAGDLTASAGKELATLAKVPAARDAIDEAIADDRSDHQVVWQAESSAYEHTRPLRKGSYPEARFDTSSCQGCEHRAMLPSRRTGEGLKPRCANIPCWNEKQQAAIEEEAERARQQALDTGEEVLNLNELPYGTYEHLGEGHGVEFDQAGCEGCEHNSLAESSYSEEPVSICLNPTCYNAKQAEAQKAQRQRAKELKAAHDEHKEQLIASFYPADLFCDTYPKDTDYQAMVYIAAQAVFDPPYSSSMSKAKVRTAVFERYGWAIPEDLDWYEVAKHLVELLEALPVEELLRLTFYAMLKPVEHDSVIFEAVYGGGEDD